MTIAHRFNAEATLEHHAALLKRITDSAFQEGEPPCDVTPPRTGPAMTGLESVEGVAFRTPASGA